MNKMNLFFNWLNSHREFAYSAIRIYLGVALLVRGLILLSDPSVITTLSGAEKVYWWYAYIIGAHILGGLLLAVGLFTRLSAAIQLPILIGAVVFIHLEEGLMIVGQSLELSVLVLFLLGIYLLFGSGHFAVDKYFIRKDRLETLDVQV